MIVSKNGAIKIFETALNTILCCFRIQVLHEQILPHANKTLWYSIKRLKYID